MATTIFRSRREASGAIVLPPADPGSFGDDAMLTVVTQELVARGQAPSFLSHGAGVWSRHLGIGEDAVNVNRWSVALRILPLLRRSRCFWCVGADVVDGHYAPELSTLLLRLCALAARAGLDTRIIGFSMNEQPHPAAVKAFRDLPSGVLLVARDEISRERTERIVDRKVELGADLAFLFERSGIESFKPGDRDLVVMVPNSYFHEELGGPQEHAELLADCVAALLAASASLSVAFIAHDVRGGALSDSALCEAVVGLVASDRVAVVEPQGHGQYRESAAQASLVVTCRMHAAIGALGECVPVIVVGYQGKAEGMLRHFDMERWCLQPEILRSPLAFAEMVTSARSENSVLRNAISTSLPIVRDLAHHNFVTRADSDDPGIEMTT